MTVLRPLALLIAALALGACASLPRPEGLARCLWVSRYEYKTAEDIERIVRDADEAGVTALMFQVRGNGTVYYRSTHEIWSETYRYDYPGFDPLATAIAAAHARGLELHAWLNIVPGWRGQPSDADPRQLVRSRPDWFFQGGEGPMALEGGYYWLDPGNPSVRAYLAALCKELAVNYSVDGVHLDHIRCPADYHEVDAVTDLVRDISKAVRSVERKPVLSAAVFPEPKVALDKVAQDWPRWARERLVDVILTMNYTDDFTAFEARAREEVRAAAGVPVIVGVGLHKTRSNREARLQIEAAESAGAAGIALFSYGGMFGKGKEQFRDAAKP